MNANVFNLFFFVGLPYTALIVCTVGIVARYRRRGFTVSSLSSQFLEGKELFWGSVPFHVGILVVFCGHLATFLFPRTTLAWNSLPVRLIILEVTAFTFGVTVLIGLAALMYRRFTNHRIRSVTSRMDILLEVLLLFQVILGLWIALGYRWGASWFAADLSPYLWSLLKLRPETAAVFVLPWVIKAHIIGAFTIILIIPFTRLIHFFVAPLHYIARPYQQVIWNWDRRTIRDPGTAWSPTRPRNN
ncbi:MAG: respiratory nitrate reductase subunit gamma [Gemmatimonadaceae bacterium]